MANSVQNAATTNMEGMGFLERAPHRERSTAWVAAHARRRLRSYSDAEGE
jgi:hypothetical protein